MVKDNIKLLIADESHIHYIDEILETITAAAKVRGTGIAKRNPKYVENLMLKGKAVLALDGDKFAGFSYIETWGGKHYVTTSGMIVPESYRGHGLARRIKHVTFSLARKRWPNAKIFSLTSGAAVMKLNTDCGYTPVTFAQLTDDETFWRGCEGCINHDVLVRTERRYCICTGMLYDPENKRSKMIADEEMESDKELVEQIIKDRFPNGFPADEAEETH
ncbi:MAG: GNAT family N-acetyltransferase [Paludibacteraceae bacterium]|nr:GNAT family N-acetyltransferase [Paludibacteraceae bacterium]